MNASARCAAFCLAFSLNSVCSAIDYSWFGLDVIGEPTIYSGNWTEVLKWDQEMDFPSTQFDSASIAPLGDPFFTVNMDVDTHIGAMNFNSPNATLELTNKIFRVDGANDWLSGTVDSSGVQVLDSGAGIFTLGADAEATFDRSNLIDTASVNVAGNLKVLPQTNNALLRVTNGITSNTGLIEILTDSTATSTLRITTGSLTNSGGGTPGMLHFDGMGTGVRRFEGNLINDGVVRVMSDASFATAGSTITNAGAWVIDPGATLSMNASSQVFDHNGNSINVLGTFEGVGLTFNFNDGTIGSNGLELTNSTLNIGSDAGDGRFTLKGGNYSGDIKFFHQVTILAENQNTTTNAANGFTNGGLLEVTSNGTGNARLIVSSGAIENLAAGTLTMSSDMGSATLDADLVNGGNVTIEGTATFGKISAQLTNTGQITIESGATFTTGVQQVWNQNGGIIDVIGSFSPSFITLNYNDGLITGQPITMSQSNLNLGPDAGSGNFVLVSGGTFSGNTQLGQTVTILSAATNSFTTAANGFSNSGEFNISSTATGEARLTISSGAMINQLSGTVTFEGTTGTRTFSGDFTNNGQVQVNGLTSFTGTNPTVTNAGQWTVAPTATLNIATGGTTFEQQAGLLDVQGEFNTAFTTINFNGGNITGTPIVITIGGLNIGPAAGTGAFVMRRSSTYSGDLKPGQQVSVLGDTQNAAIVASNPFSNSGQLLVESTGASSILTVNGGPLVNNADGEIRFTGAGQKELRADVTNQGLITINNDASIGTTNKVITSSGQFVAQAIATMVGTSFTNEQAGQITGSGGLNTNSTTFTNSGEIAPGDGVGTFSITGSMTSTSTALLSIEIGGTTLGSEYDQLTVSGTATLDGMLAVDLIDLGGGVFEPSFADTFTVLTAGTLSGAFANVASGSRLATLGGEGSFLVTYDGTSNSVVFSEFASVLEGDFNSDGTVDLADYTVWRNNLGAAIGTLPNDTTGLPIGTAQYDQWKANYGSTLPVEGANNAVVPEPSAVWLLLIVLPAWRKAIVGG